MNPNMLLMALGAVIVVMLVVMFMNSGSELLEKIVTDDHIDTGINSLEASTGMGKGNAYIQGGHGNVSYDSLGAPIMAKNENSFPYATTTYIQAPLSPATDAVSLSFANQNAYGNTTRFIKQLESQQGDIVTSLSDLGAGIIRATAAPPAVGSMFLQSAN